MKLTISGKQMDVGEALTQHIEESLPEAVAKYFDNTTETTVTLTKDHHIFRCDIQVHVSKRVTVHGQGGGGDAYAAFEEASEHVVKRLRRYKRRLRDHKNRGDHDLEILRANAYILKAEDDSQAVETEDQNAQLDQPVIIAELLHEIETLSVGEAVMRMDLGNVPALLFKSSKHGGLNLVYQRSDGNIGWIDPNILPK